MILSDCMRESSACPRQVTSALTCPSIKKSFTYLLDDIVDIFKFAIIKMYADESIYAAVNNESNRKML